MFNFYCIRRYPLPVIESLIFVIHTELDDWSVDYSDRSSVRPVLYNFRRTLCFCTHIITNHVTLPKHYRTVKTLYSTPGINKSFVAQL